MSGKRMTEMERELLRDMIREGADYDEIAATFNVTPSAVTYHAIRMGLARRGAHKPETPRPVVVIPAHSLFTAARVGAWALDALCAETDPEIFFPEKGGSTREAKAVCGRCPVTQECLDYALATGQRDGIWGAKSERERRKLATTYRSPA